LRPYGTKLAGINEAWTSKTCSCGGHIKHNLSGPKVCKYWFYGGFEMDGDVNGAKNAFLKNFEALGISASAAFGACLPFSEVTLGQCTEDPQPQGREIFFDPR